MVRTHCAANTQLLKRDQRWIYSITIIKPNVDFYPTWKCTQAPEDCGSNHFNPRGSISISEDGVYEASGSCSHVCLGKWNDIQVLPHE